MVLEPEQTGALSAEAHDLEQHLTGVVRAAAASACHGSGEKAVAHVWARQCRERRLAGGEHERQEPTREAAGPRRLAGGRAGAGVEAGELGLVGDVHRKVVRVGEELLLERGRQRREPFVQRAESFAFGGIESRARQHGLAVRTLDEIHLIGIEAELVPPAVEHAESGEQAWIEPDRVAMGGEPRCELGFEGVEGLVGVGGARVLEHGQYTPKQRTRPLERHEGVLEGGRCGILRDRLHFVALLLQACLDRLEVVFRTHEREHRQSVGERTRLEEGVVGTAHPTTLLRTCDARGGRRLVSMHGISRSESAAAAAPRDVYTHGHHASVVRTHAWRTVENSAAYLVPFLAEGQQILDIGSGPGTISIDLAKRVRPGTVIGIDESAEIVQQASGLAASAAIENVTFRVGDAYVLDFPDATFDVVHAHQVVQHLARPVDALREFRRVLKPGGIVAARDVDYGGVIWSPESPELTRWLELYQDVHAWNGGDAHAGRHLRRYAREAGFTEVETSGSVWVFASDLEREWWGGAWSDRAVESQFAAHAIESGHSSARRAATHLRRLAGMGGGPRWMVPHAARRDHRARLSGRAAQASYQSSSASCASMIASLTTVPSSSSTMGRPSSHVSVQWRPAPSPACAASAAAMRGRRSAGTDTGGSAPNSHRVPSRITHPSRRSPTSCGGRARRRRAGPRCCRPR